jgi:hypothetical protein
LQAFSLICFCRRLSGVKSRTGHEGQDLGGRNPAGKPEEALRNLKFAFEHRLAADMRQALAKDADLNSLHDDPRFAALAAP